MKHLPIALLALAVGPLVRALPVKQPKFDVCRIAAKPADWIGKDVRVEGYVLNLGSHGYVLTSGRGCAGHGQLGLFIDRIDGEAVWQSAFKSSNGPKRAILMGRVRWEQARMGGSNPALDVRRIESISSREARLNEIS